jgi:hypothetical protein
MNDTINEEMAEQNGNDVVNENKSLSPVAGKESDETSENIEIEQINENDEKNEEIDSTTTTIDDPILKGTALLKSLLSTSTASLVPVVEKMITTTEVTDETLNLKKILYQPDKEKTEEKETEVPAQNGQQLTISETPIDDDDQRLVIDISDEEKDGTGTSDQKNNGKSMPSLNASRNYENRSLKRTARPTTLETSPFPIRPMTRHLVRVQSE